MEDNKKCTTIWLRPSVIRRMDAWLEEANCRSRSEFIEKAVRFYMGYLGTEDTSEYLSDALVATLRGIIADSTNRTNGIACRNGDVPAKICVKSLEKAVIFSLLLYHIQALAFSFSNFT